MNAIALVGSVDAQPLITEYRSTFSMASELEKAASPAIVPQA